MTFTTAPLVRTLSPQHRLRFCLACFLDLDSATLYSVATGAPIRTNVKTSDTPTDVMALVSTAIRVECSDTRDSSLAVLAPENSFVKCGADHGPHSRLTSNPFISISTTT
ncbi:hypothetical protein GN244_ATG09340 [Phytophthora infestans]|uniref:Uncharacterized protein n=1 Tax=Phytophthora infestans TaxID=4787 RepID=A0A833STP5_PHYIN|nr:hypothetical protein GN244_ATG09340 [Phytophthora infestans]KAF4147829.1 hypothetical protein GN958_ATG02993 [Phytophthora infestans]